MAPEFPYLRTNGTYLDYINALEGYYDFIAPQYYNQGGDGIWVDELNAWITQNNDAMKEDFLYYLTESLVTGTRGYAKDPGGEIRHRSAEQQRYRRHRLRGQQTGGV